ncbi:MAG TPA: A24 family peptidase [Candidatus Eisenbacteria bacterium]|nr:A24 family peptidase [Candidatus Eisenbacteria bacterium]
MNVPLWVAAPVIVLVSVAARADVRSRTIPNRFTFPALLVALAAHGVLGGAESLKSSLIGMAVAGGLLMPGWMFRWMGAGDVKLMAAVGAWLAWPQALIAVLASLVMGGAISLIVAIRRGVLRQALAGAAAIGASALSRSVPPPVTTGVRIPFALAILAGSTFALWFRP